MAETHYVLDRDLEEARDIVQGLEEYVRGDSVYGTVGGMFASDPGAPSLTIGNLLLRLRRLRAMAGQLSPAHQETLAQVEAEHERIRNEWTVHYGQKASDEATARLRSLETFVSECENAPETCANNYLPEARRRTILQELSDGASQHLDDSSLTRVDGNLRGLTEPHAFLWDTQLQPVYPQSKFWWLYQRPADTYDTE